MKIHLTRFGSIPGIGTFGELKIGMERFFTVEKEWLDNEKFVSCVPSGVYELERHDSKKYSNVWALVSERLGVLHYDKSAKRYACLIHAANYPSDVSGCIGPGKLLMHLNGRLGVNYSRDAIARLRLHLNTGGTHTLNIKWENIGEIK